MSCLFVHRLRCSSVLLGLLIVSTPVWPAASNSLRADESPAEAPTDGDSTAGDSAADGPSATTPPATDTQRKLIEQLGDVNFDTRETAARQLAVQGLDAKAALIEGMGHVDLEIRMRSHQLLIRTMRVDFERRLTAFIDDDQNKSVHRLPAWELFRKRVGEDRASRKLFADMLRQEMALLETLQEKPAAAVEALDNRVREVQTRAFGGINGFYDQPNIHPATLATLLFIGSETTNSNSSSLLYSLLNQSRMKQTVNGGQHSRVMKQLLEHWILASDGSSQAYYGLLLALNYNLRETGLKLGRRHLEQPRPSSTVLQYAAIAVGRFGTGQDVALLEKHMENTTVCHTWSNRQLKKGLIKIQIRDIILCMLIHVTDQNPRNYGFNLLQENPMTLYHIYTFGFLEDEERDAALTKWQQWKEKNTAG